MSSIYLWILIGDVEFNSSVEVASRERESFGMWSYYLSKHIFCTCRILSTTQSLHEANSINDIFVKLSSTLHDRLILLSEPKFVQKTFFKRQTIEFILTGILSGCCISRGITNSSNSRICHLPLLGICRPLIFSLRRDPTVLLRVKCIELCRFLLGMDTSSSRPHQGFNGLLDYNSGACDSYILKFAYQVVQMDSSGDIGSPLKLSEICAFRPIDVVDEDPKISGIARQVLKTIYEHYLQLVLNPQSNQMDGISVIEPEEKSKLPTVAISPKALEFAGKVSFEAETNNANFRPKNDVDTFEFDDNLCLVTPLKMSTVQCEDLLIREIDREIIMSSTEQFHAGLQVGANTGDKLDLIHSSPGLKLKSAKSHSVYTCSIRSRESNFGDDKLLLDIDREIVLASSIPAKKSCEKEKKEVLPRQSSPRTPALKNDTSTDFLRSSFDPNRHFDSVLDRIDGAFPEISSSNLIIGSTQRYDSSLQTISPILSRSAAVDDSQDVSPGSKSVYISKLKVSANSESDCVMKLQDLKSSKSSSMCWSDKSLENAIFPDSHTHSDSRHADRDFSRQENVRKSPGMLSIGHTKLTENFEVEEYFEPYIKSNPDSADNPKPLFEFQKNCKKIENTQEATKNEVLGDKIGAAITAHNDAPKSSQSNLHESGIYDSIIMQQNGCNPIQSRRVRNCVKFILQHMIFSSSVKSVSYSHIYSDGLLLGKFENSKIDPSICQIVLQESLHISLKHAFNLDNLLLLDFCQDLLTDTANTSLEAWYKVCYVRISVFQKLHTHLSGVSRSLFELERRMGAINDGHTMILLRDRMKMKRVGVDLGTLKTGFRSLNGQSKLGFGVGGIGLNLSALGFNAGPNSLVDWIAAAEY